MRTRIHTQAEASYTATLMRKGLVQRTCACGGMPDLPGECEKCRRKRLTPQPSLRQVQRTTGQPLEPATRAFIETRFGHDFSRLRIYTNNRAADTASTPLAVVQPVPGLRVQRQEEALTQTARVGPIDALRARRDAQAARRDAQASGLPGVHNGPQDAWRHCYWNCLMTHSIGEGQAQTVADTHEELGGNPANERTMDLHNNAEGRACGQTSQDRSACGGCCTGRLHAGNLLIIPDWAGAARKAPVPSS